MNRNLTRVIAVFYAWTSLSLSYILYHMARYGQFHATIENVVIAMFEFIMSIVSSIVALYLVYRVVRK